MYERIAPARYRVALFALTVACAAAPAAAPSPDLPAQARDVLARHCASCHDHGQAKGGLGRITDLARLVERGRVVPGRAADSPLFQRVADGEMPPPKRRGSFSSRETVLLRAWIAAGASAGEATVGRPVAEAELLARVRADLERLAPRERRFARYLSLAPLAVRPARERRALADAVAKLVNSLSWHPRLTAPLPVGADGLLVRLDLRHYRWQARTWDRLATLNPYRPADPTPTMRDLATLTGAEQPCLRADWFVATASRPPFYHEFLALPTSDRALERLLQVDVSANLADDTAVRAGFNGSGVARFNRVLERHDGAHGAYWRSYDFAEALARQNVFDRPLGPAPGPAAFRHDGGEIVFHLPNGLQGYLLVDADGRRIDRAPGEIVSDPRRPDRLVETGLSCLGCHAQGIVPKDDQVRAHVLKNARSFADADRDAILALYAPAARLRRLVLEDNARFAAALRHLGLAPAEPEPVLAAVLRHEEDVDAARAAAELGTTVEEFGDRLKALPELMRTLGPLRARGTVSRAVFESAYARLIPAAATVPSADAGALTLPRGRVAVLASSADGRGIAAASDDGEIHVWTAEGTPGRLLGSHPGVRALAVTADGSRLLSAGADRLVRVWDLRRAAEPARLVGHTSGLRAVVVSADGKTAVSAGEDRSIRVWDLTRGTLRRARAAHDGTITALAVSPDGTRLLSGGTDRTARLWDLATGEALGRFDHAGEVHAVAFSPDGRRFVTGGSGGHLTLREAATGREVMPLERQRGTVVAAVYRGDGRLLFSASAERDGLFLSRHDVVGSWGAETSSPTPAQAVVLCPDGRSLVARGAAIRRLPAPP